MALPLLAISCTEDLSMEQVEQGSYLPIEIASNYPVRSQQTRASLENGFVSDDAVGVFVVDYDKEGNPGTPALKGDRAGNIKFTFDGESWKANYQLYWKNSSTPADFYGYYPYDQEMQSVTDYNFSIVRRQDSDATKTAAAGYEASDLLWSKATKVMPTTETINLQYKHLMAGVTVTLEQGTGFTAEEWATLDKTVLIESTILNGTADLSNGKVMVGDGVPTPIIPLSHNGTYRAVVFPQNVSAGNPLVTVTVDGMAYPLKKTVVTNYISGKMHNMTITVNKSSSVGDYTLTLAADDVVAWIDDPTLHDGLVRQYTIVTLQKAGTLKIEVDKICDDYSKLTNLKIIGPMNGDDRNFIQNNLVNLREVNMYYVTMEDGRLGGFRDHKRLQHFVFPMKGIKVIEYAAFNWCPLLGDLIIPEGVEIIDSRAFMDCRMKGRLIFPSTLKRIENAAFAINHFTGELHLPDGIEYVDGGYYEVFQESDFEGTLYLPQSLIAMPCLRGMSKLTGTIVVPPKVTEIGGLFGIGCTQIQFHDGVTAIGGLENSQLSGELVLPPHTKKVMNVALAGTKISRVIFNDELQYIDNSAFANCAYLTGTMQFAKNVSRIPRSCFQGCTAMTGIVLPKNVCVIDIDAFRNCYSLNSIVCENPEPPAVLENAFLGVPKDNFTVEVPKGSVEKYREAPGWKEFKRIAEYSNFVCRPMQANALNTAHTEQLVLNADGPWQVERMPDWVTLSKTNGTGKTELTLTFQQMAHGAGNRTDTIHFVMPSEGHKTFCVVSQYDYEHEEDSHIALQTHTKGRGIDIVFIGDGYDGEDISNGNYLNLVKEQTEHFFDLEPYKSHREFFNVYVTFPLSQEKGVNTMNTYVNNHFGTLYGYDGLMCTSNQLLTETSDVRDYAVEHTPLTQDALGRSLIILVPNSDAYMGVTYYEREGLPISICPPSSRSYPQDTRGVVQHEAGGHGFGRLGDEEIVYSAWAPANVKSEIESRQGSGWYANLATTSGLHSVPWADFVFDTRYSDQVDVFEGGFGYMRGIFRPEQNSCMNYGIPYYNAPSRLAIMRRIFDYGGEHFDMDYFYEHDSNAWGSTDGSRQTRSVVGNASERCNSATGTLGSVPHYGGSSYAGSNQHRAPQTIDGMTMSREVKRIREQLKNKNK